MMQTAYDSMQHAVIRNAKKKSYAVLKIVATIQTSVSESETGAFMQQLVSIIRPLIICDNWFGMRSVSFISQPMTIQTWKLPWRGYAQQITAR